MKLSTTTAIYRFRQDGSYVPIGECAKILYRTGYRDIDINFCKADQMKMELSEDDWESWAKRLKEELDRMGMTAEQSHTPFYNVIDPSFPTREHTEEMVRRSIIASGILGVKAVVIHGGTDYFNPDIEDIKRRNVEYFKPHLELAEKCSVSIAIENMFDMRDHQLGIRKRRYLTAASELIDLVDTLKNDFDNVGICWDFGHANEAAWRQDQALKMIGKRLIATHVNDNYGVIDDHLLPFLGTVPWEPLMKTLKEIHYDGSFAFETHKFTQYIPDEIIEEALKFSVVVGNYLLSLAK